MVRDVGGEFGRRAPARDANGVDDGLDAFGLADIGVLDDDYFGYAFDEAAPLDVYCDRLVMSLGDEPKLSIPPMTACRPQLGYLLAKPDWWCLNGNIEAGVLHLRGAEKYPRTRSG